MTAEHVQLYTLTEQLDQADATLGPTDGPVLILLDALPEELAVQICLERLLRLRPGESAEIYSSQEADVQRVCRWIHGFDPTRYGLARLPPGLTQSALQVTRRHAT